MKLKILLIFQILFVLSLQVFCKKGSGVENSKNEIASSLAQPELTVFEAPAGAPKNETFSVYVRYEGSKWIDMYEYDAEVDGGFLKKPVHHMAFVSFDSDFSRRIDVRVEKNSGNVSGVKLRPAIAGIEPVVDGNSIEFSLTSPQKISVEVNEDLHNNLMVFANNLETDVPDKNNPDVVYFSPGIHKIGGDGKGTLNINEDNRKVYIAGGAIVYGSISVSGSDDVSITGRGILCGGMYTDHAYPHPEGKNLILINNSTNVYIEGITLLNTVKWNIHLAGCEEVVCKNLKIIGWTINSDGVNPTYSSNVKISDCFVRNYDDCISIKLGYGLGGSTNTKGSHNIMVQNCIFWTDQGVPVKIGSETYSVKDKYIENITIRNIDVLYVQNYDVARAKGVVAILLGDDATVRNVTFEDIRVGKMGGSTDLVNLRILQSPFNVSPGRSIQNISFNRITLNSTLPINNFIHGYDDSRMIDEIHFTDLKINGSYVKNLEEGKFDINPYARNITFRVTGN